MAPLPRLAPVCRLSALLALATLGFGPLACGTSTDQNAAGAAGLGAMTAGGSGGTPGAGGASPSSSGASGDSSSGAPAIAGSAGTSVSGDAGAGSGGTSGSSSQAGAGGGAGRGGAPAGGAPAGGGPNGGGANGGAAGGGGSAGNAGVGLTKDGETLLSKAGLSLVSYGGYLNGESFQEEGMLTFKGYQYAAFWNTSRHVVLARRALPSGAWATLEFSDYTNTESDAHNTISLGICAADGTLHLAFDHHVSTLHYRKSVAGLASDPAAATWATSSFSATTSRLVGNTNLTQVTYPRFVTEPGGGKLLFEARIGTSGSGDEYLWEYDGASHAWASLGRFIFGTGDSINAYPHGLSYTRGGSRLHLSWCWRETSDAATNHDLLYIYSDDNGRTWKNDSGATVATTGTTSITKASPGIKTWTIAQHRGLINQEHMVVDAAGRVHVLLSHLPDSAADNSNFDSARTKSQFFHYMKDVNGTWTRTALNLPVVAAFRGKLGVARSGNLYAVLPDLRIAATSAGSNFKDWKVLDTQDSGRFFSDPLIDTQRLLTEDKLSIFYPQKSSPNVYVLDYSVQ